MKKLTLTFEDTESKRTHNVVIQLTHHTPESLKQVVSANVDFVKSYYLPESEDEQIEAAFKCFEVTEA